MLTVNENEDGKMVTITQVRFHELIEAERHLDHLHATGVDNWGDYSYPADDEDEE